MNNVVWNTFSRFKAATAPDLQWYYTFEVFSGMRAVQRIQVSDQEGVTHIYSNVYGENIQPSNLPVTAIRVDSF